MRPARLDLPAFCFCGDLQHFVKKDGRYTCEPFEFPVASLDEVFVFHLGMVNLQDTFAIGLIIPKSKYGVIIIMEVGTFLIVPPLFFISYAIGIER